MPPYGTGLDIDNIDTQIRQNLRHRMYQTGAILPDGRYDVKYLIQRLSFLLAETLSLHR